MRLITPLLFFTVLTPLTWGWEEEGKASFYTERCSGGGITACGEMFDEDALTAAHKTLPLGTKVLVTNTNTGKQVRVRINDRGPFIKGRIIDLSKAAFAEIAPLKKGVVPVEVEVVSLPDKPFVYKSKKVKSSTSKTTLTMASTDPLVVITEEVALHQGVKKGKINYDKPLGSKYKEVLGRCSSRLRRRVEGVTAQTDVYGLLAKFAKKD